MKKVIIAAAIVGTILGAGLLGSAKGDKAMDVTNNGFVTDKVIPEIDAVVPKITETATFALG